MEQLKELFKNLENCKDIVLLNDLRNQFFNSPQNKDAFLPPYLYDALNYFFGKRACELLTGTTDLSALVGEVKNNNQYIMLTRKNKGGLILRKEDIQYVFCNGKTSTIRSIHGEFEVLELTEDFIKLFNN